jgi:hypothetical protein
MLPWISSRIEAGQPRNEEEQQGRDPLWPLETLGSTLLATSLVPGILLRGWFLLPAACHPRTAELTRRDVWGWGGDESAGYDRAARPSWATSRSPEQLSSSLTASLFPARCCSVPLQISHRLELASPRLCSQSALATQAHPRLPLAPKSRALSLQPHELFLDALKFCSCSPNGSDAAMKAKLTEFLSQQM